MPERPIEVSLEELGPRNDEDLTFEERADLVADSLLSRQVAGEREADLLKNYGKTSKDLEAEADAWLKSAGFEDLVEGDK